MTKTFEQQLQELETIVKELESKDIELDKAVKLYKEGLELTKECLKKIQDAEKLIVEEIID